MKSRIILILAASLAFVAAAVSCKPKAAPADNDYIVAAYIWPSCHDDSLAHEYLWEEGIGEWQVIKRGDPRFEGHYQPKLPLWGYELDDDPVVVEKWINTALEQCRFKGFSVSTGVFGADMQVESINDGPVTIILDTGEL